MMNNYLEIDFIPTKHGGGAFECKATFLLDNFSMPFKDINVKIDTGCSISTIPIKRLGVPNDVCLKKKLDDIDNNVEYLRSYGVETGGLIHYKPITRQDMVSCEALKFKHSVKNFMLNGIHIPVQNIYLNYNRSGNILIGMDILSKMVCHWDISRKNGEFVMLCCDRNFITDEFYTAMKEHFGLTKDVQ